MGWQLHVGQFLHYEVGHKMFSNPVEMKSVGCVVVAANSSGV